MNDVTQSGIDGMDDMAAWAEGAVAGTFLAPARELSPLQRAVVAHLAGVVRNDVGRYAGGLEYVPVYCHAIREMVTVGFEYTPAEPGDDEQPEIGEYVEIQETWLRGINIGPLFSDEETDKLLDAIKAGARDSL